MCLDEELIEAVKKQPLLYDVRHKYYYDVGIKDNAWLEIAASFDMGAEALKRRWVRLRDCYRKAMLRKSCISSLGPNILRTWKYEKQMSFLKSHLGINGPRKSKLSNIVNNSQNSEPESSDEIKQEDDSYENEVKAVQDEPVYVNDQISVEFDTFDQFPASMQNNSPTKPTRNSYQGDSEHPSGAEEIPRIYSSDKSLSKLATNDHLNSFFKAMEDTVRTFSPLEQAEVKSKISNLVSEYEIRSLSNKSGQKKSH